MLDKKSAYAILTILEEGSMTKAQNKMKITQPAISKIIYKLEKSVGVPLFEKTSIPWKLTFAGKIYVKKAREFLKVEQELRKEIKDVLSFTLGKITIGLAISKEREYLDDIVSLVKKNNPDFQIKIINDYSKNIEILIEQNIVDIAILVYGEEKKSNKIKYIPINEESIFIAISNSTNINYNTKELELNLLNKQMFILPKSNPILKDAIEKACNKNGFQPECVLEVFDMEAAMSLVDKGMAVAFTCNPNEKYEKIKNFKLKNLNSVQTTAFAYRKGKRLNKVENDVLKLVVNRFNAS